MKKVEIEKHSDKVRRVVITGMGMVTPLGNNVSDTWENLIKGECGIDRITLFDVEHFPCQIAAEVKDFDLDQIIQVQSKYKEEINRGASFGIAATKEALVDALIYDDEKLLNECGIVLGNSGARTELKAFEENLRCQDLTTKVEVAHIDTPKNYFRNRYAAAAEIIADIFKFRRGCISITTACTSGTQSVGLGYRMIQQEKSDMMVVGGCDSMITELDLIGFCMLGAVTSQHNENPKQASRPFNRDRSGFVLGEGAGILVLEEYEHAKARNAKIYGEIVGFGNSISAYSIIDTPPDGRGLINSMNKALAEAKLSNKEIGYVNMHGTSTRDNDSSETMAIKHIFPKEENNVPISSTKSSTGHLISGAGAVEIIFTINAIRYGVLPPTINLVDVDGKCDINHIYEPQQANIKYGMSNSLGFGGSNSTLIVKKYGENNEF